MAIGPLDPAPIFPTPVAMQFVFDGHANEERELRVNPVNVSVPHGAATPALPNPPEMAIGVPERESWWFRWPCSRWPAEGRPDWSGR